MTQPDLFGGPVLPKGLSILRGFVHDEAEALMAIITDVSEATPFRTMQVPGGGTMSVAMTNCGQAGWVTDAKGYRYSPDDPLSGAPWPVMPQVLADLAMRASHEAGFGDFVPDGCLINRYAPGARTGLHQDRDEADRKAPIVSVSLGLPATFLFGGLKRSDAQIRLDLEHGDVVVWGGPARLAYHGIAPLKAGIHPLTGQARYNLTLRKSL